MRTVWQRCAGLKNQNRFFKFSSFQEAEKQAQKLISDLNEQQKFSLQWNANSFKFLSRQTSKQEVLRNFDDYLRKQIEFATEKQTFR